MPEDYKLTDIIAALEPIPDWQPQGMRDLARRVRWEQGWQGAGPLSYRSLKRTVGGESMRQTFRAIDGNSPPQSLRQAFERLGFPIGGGVTRLPQEPISLRQIARRTLSPDTIKLKFVSYNTYLLQGLQIPLGRWIDDAIGWDALSWFGIPFGGALLTLLGITSPIGVAVGTVLELAGWTPSKVIKQITGVDLNGIRIQPKPALEARASELALPLSGYDICCLCEVWTKELRDLILDGFQFHRDRAWEYAPGPDESGDWTFAGSGLLFLSKKHHIVKTERMVYSNRGNRRHDSDAWSNKGVMLNVVDLGFGQLELFQTHLYFGGGMPEITIPAVDVPVLSEPSYQERMNVWLTELAELADFFRRHHREENVAIITGDFNMSGANVREYAEIRRTMDKLNMQDLWAWDVYSHNPSQGDTCRFTDGRRWCTNCRLPQSNVLYPLSTEPSHDHANARLHGTFGEQSRVPGEKLVGLRPRVGAAGESDCLVR